MLFMYLKIKLLLAYFFLIDLKMFDFSFYIITFDVKIYHIVNRINIAHLQTKTDFQSYLEYLQKFTDLKAHHTFS